MTNISTANILNESNAIVPWTTVMFAQPTAHSLRWPRGPIAAVDTRLNLAALSLTLRSMLVMTRVKIRSPTSKNVSTVLPSISPRAPPTSHRRARMPVSCRRFSVGVLEFREVNLMIITKSHNERKSYYCEECILPLTVCFRGIFFLFDLFAYDTSGFWPATAQGL